MAGKYTEFYRLPDGNLRITLLPGAREEVEAILKDQSLDSDTRLVEVIEWQLGSGWSFVTPESIGALTSAPILSEEVDYDDYGDVRQVGTVYWYSHYEVYDPVEQLLVHGAVDFEQVK